MITEIRKALCEASRDMHHVCTLCLSPMRHDALRLECWAPAPMGNISRFMGIEVRVHPHMPDNNAVFMDSYGKIVGVIKFEKPE